MKMCRTIASGRGRVGLLFQFLFFAIGLVAFVTLFGLNVKVIGAAITDAK